MGLGLDRIRSQAIWSVLDPQFLVCFYGKPTGGHDYSGQMAKTHADILREAAYHTPLPFDDFTFSFSKICALALDFHSQGDVIVVSDGPKPLSLASSLAPLFLQETGIVCFHVGRRRTSEFTPIDVRPTGAIYGFRFSGVSDGFQGGPVERPTQ